MHTDLWPQIAKSRPRNLFTWRRERVRRARRQMRLQQIFKSSGMTIAVAASFLAGWVILDNFRGETGQERDWSNVSTVTDALAAGKQRVKTLIAELDGHLKELNSSGGSNAARSFVANAGDDKSIAVTPLSQSDGSRIALVVGNGSYSHFDLLRNPVNDARLMERTLRDLSFDVEVVTDATETQMEQSIIRFKRRLQEESRSAVGLFFYSGHGVQSKGLNYLIPVDANIDREEELPYEAVDAGAVLNEMTGVGNNLNIVILDACRNNPYRQTTRGGASGGLAQLSGPIGSLIAYAAAPGTTARDGDGSNSPYTEALAREMRKRGSLEEVFRRVRVAVRDVTDSDQIPWESTSLTRPFYFVGTQSEAPGAIDSSNDEIARTSLIRKIQVGLNRIGFDAGEANGRLEHQTRLAIASFSDARGIGMNDHALTTGLLDEIESAGNDGFVNFLGCRTEQISRVVKVRQKVPPTTVMNWEPSSESVRFRAEASCNPFVVCGYHYDIFLRPVPNYSINCDLACKRGVSQFGVISAVFDELVGRCEREARFEDGKNASVSDTELSRCKCPDGEMLCYCVYEADCEFEKPVESTVYHDDELVDRTVADTRQVCECRSPEVANRECTVPQS